MLCLIILAVLAVFAIGAYVFWKRVFLTFPFITGPWLKFLHMFDSCYTTNTHQNLVALWAKACSGNMGYTSDNLSQYYLPPLSRVFCKGLISKILYSNLFKQSSIFTRVNAIDKGLQEAINQGYQQFVVVGSGFDIRPFRFAKQGIKYIEIDLPHVIQQKKLLNQRLFKKFPQYKQFEPAFICIDLSSDKKLDLLRKNPAYDPKLKTCILSEAVLVYLDHPNAQEVLLSMAEIADKLILFESKEPLAIKGRTLGTNLSELASKNMVQEKCEVVPPHKNAYYSEFIKKK